jgi:hypothetical protein
VGFYGLAGTLLICVMVAVGAVGYSKGAASRNDEIASLQAAIETSNRLAAEAEDRAAKVSERVVVEYKDRVRVIREQAPASVELVEVIRESPGNCLLPAEFVRVWNGPPSGSAEAQPPAGTDGSAITLADAAAVAAEARERFEVNAARLEALQSFIRDQ